MVKRGPREGAFREPKQARTRRQLARILAVADALFAARGFEGTRLSDIAREVPCSMSAIYDRFKSKDDLLRYMQQRGIDESLAVIRRVQPPAPGAGDLREVLPGAIRAGLQIMRRYRGVRRAALERAPSDPVLAAQEAALRGELASAMEGFLLAFRHQIRHPAPALAVRYAQGVLSAAVEQREGSAPEPQGLRLTEAQFVDESVRMLLTYLDVADA